MVLQQLIQRVILPFSGDVQIRRSHTEANESAAFQNPLRPEIVEQGARLNPVQP
jgi:hypothetical protein